MGEELYGRLMCKKISIIIPVYNAERFLRRCLDSVLNQSYSNWECIIVDEVVRTLHLPSVMNMLRRIVASR